MSKHSLLIIGCGDLGRRVGDTLLEQGWSISAVRRNPPPHDTRFHWTAADYCVPGSLDFAERLRPEIVLASFTPTSMDLDGYQRGFAEGAANVLRGLGNHRPKLVMMVSSTRVYEEAGGGWVDENSAMSSTDERALAIIEAEQLLLNSEHAITIVRFGGIYGGAPGRLLTKIARGQIAPASPVRYTNRIHREDCAGFLAHLITFSQTGQLLAAAYNGVDSYPAPAHEVEGWIAAKLGIDGVQTDVKIAEQSVSHKRCSNALMLASGYSLRYPDYRAGYAKVCADEEGG